LRTDETNQRPPSLQTGGLGLELLSDTLDNSEDLELKRRSSPAASSSQKPASHQKAKSKRVIPYRSDGRDAELFDIAFETRDLLAMVELLPSQQQIGIDSDDNGQRMHPWAEDPKTVGALAASQLAIIASSADRAKEDGESAAHYYNVKDEIRDAGAISPLVTFLQSKEPDRAQASIVALSFLTADCEMNAALAYDCGAMPILLEYTESPIPGLRAAAAVTVSHMAKVSKQCNEEFVALGGLRALIAQLDCTAGRGTNLADLQLEAVLNLQDVLEIDVGTLNSEHARKAVELGAIEGLTRLSRAEDTEVQESAMELLEELTQVISISAVNGVPAAWSTNARSSTDA
jgi:hypothetical protein